jgi:hypothetical protein
VLLPYLIATPCFIIAGFILRHSIRQAKPRRDAKGIKVALRRWKASLEPEATRAPRSLIRR